jgi:hypothetical protein
MRILPFIFIAATALTANAQAAELSRRDAALRIMGFLVFVPGAAAYCIKKHGFPEGAFTLVGQWNKKHEPVMRKALSIIEETGGMSKEVRAALDKFAYRMVVSQIDADDAKGNCSALSEALKTDVVDISKSPDLSDALAIVMSE